MSIAINFTKLVVRDVATAERFYRAVGLEVVSRNVGGEDDVAQEQCWLSATGDASAHTLILSRFLELPPPPRPVYPGEAWLVFNVSDVDATIRTVELAGGTTVKPGQDRPEHNVRAAVVSDPEGHLIELVGPMGGVS
jgi:catechol 2,3-dioxygenase-like lactoylglutathione lyase family enzyme